MARRSGLGKGLDAIIPTDVADGGEAVLQDLPVAGLRPNRFQPRQEFDDDSLADLTASVQEVGVLQPVLVRRSRDGGYELIAGERRLRAAVAAGLETIPAIIRPVDDERSLEQALVENLQREDLNPIEEAVAYRQLTAEFGLTQEQVAARVGRSRAAVANTLRLLQLPEELRERVSDGRLAAGHGRALLATDDVEFQLALADEVLAATLTVRDVEEAVRAHVTSDGEPQAPPAVGSTKPPALLELEQLLADRLDTRVDVRLGARKGRIAIEFADLADLERIFRLIS